MVDDLKNKNALVTGASRGIGKRIAQSLLKKGVHVYGISRSLIDMKELSKVDTQEGAGKFIPIEADLSSEQEIHKIVGQVKGLDILVHNAAFFELAPLEDLTQESWERHIQVNLTAPFLLTQLLWKKLKKSVGKESSIVFISSLAGVQNKDKFPGACAYTASKMGLVGLCEAIAAEGKEFNIRANCLSPGAVETKMLRDAFPAMKADFTPKNIADIVLYYASEISKPITGTNVIIQV